MEKVICLNQDFPDFQDLRIFTFCHAMLVKFYSHPENPENPENPDSDILPCNVGEIL